MIDPRELRIGNLVTTIPHNNCYVVEVTSIDADGINGHIPDNYGDIKTDLIYDEYFPLAMKEWLVRFGFALWCGDYNLNGVDIFEVEVGVFVLNGQSKTIGKTFKHVHQLQNLYFALTGEELTIK